MEGLYYEILSETQLHFETKEGVKLFDTSMEFDGQKFKTSQEILEWLLNR
jgi:hypothetical protein